MNLRVFFALRLTEKVARELADFADELCEFDRGLDALWVDSSSFHLTLCFLGEVSIDRVEELETKVRDHLSMTRFSIQLNRIDYYEVSQSLSVIAAMAAEQSELADLHRQLVTLSIDADLDYSEQNFIPHVTLARLPAQNNFSTDTRFPPIEMNFPVESVVLLQSRPGDRGSTYTPLFEVELLKS